MISHIKYIRKKIKDKKNKRKLRVLYNAYESKYKELSIGDTLIYKCGPLTSKSLIILACTIETPLYEHAWDAHKHITIKYHTTYYDDIDGAHLKASSKPGKMLLTEKKYKLPKKHGTYPLVNSVMEKNTIWANII